MLIRNSKFLISTKTNYIEQTIYYILYTIYYIEYIFILNLWEVDLEEHFRLNVLQYYNKLLYHLPWIQCSNFYKKTDIKSGSPVAHRK